ncbi:MAG: hypothetical protein ACUVQ4_02615 [bacterium]
MIKYSIIAIILCLMFIVILHIILFRPAKDNNQYITLKEVIPDAKILSETEGVIEYEGKRFILGLNNFKKKRDIINDLNFLKLQGNLEIDLRFNRQVIVRAR